MSFIADIFKGGAEGLLSGIKDAVSAFKADPTKVVEFETELRKVEADLTLKLAQADAAAITAVNRTMQAEAASDKWMQWSWRPTIGFTFAGVIVNNYILLPYFKLYGLVPISIPSELWTAMLVILGAAAATRGWANVEKVRKAGG